MFQDLIVILLSIIKNKDDIKCLIFKKNLYEILYNKPEWYVYDEYGRYAGKNSLCSIATAVADIFLLKYGCDRDYYMDSETLKNAVCGGHMECIKYLHENRDRLYIYVWQFEIQQKQRVCLGTAINDWDKQVLNYAAEGGHINCIKYLRENGYKWNKHATLSAAKEGHLSILMFVHENGCSWHEDTTWGAAKYGHLDCLKYAHENGCPWNEVTKESAYDCPWHEATTKAAASGGHLECLKYAHENGCSLNHDDIITSAFQGYIDSLQEMNRNKHIQDISALTFMMDDNKYVECIKYARKIQTQKTIKI